MTPWWRRDRGASMAAPSTGGSVLGDERQHRLAIAVGLDRADTGDVEQRPGGAWAGGGDGRQRGVGEDHVRGRARRPRLAKTPVDEGVVERRVAFGDTGGRLRARAAAL